MAYTKWQADWKNLPDQTTPIVEGFLDHVETALDTQDDRIVVTEAHLVAVDPHGDRAFATSRAVALAIVLGG